MDKATALHLMLEVRYLNFTDGPRAWWKDADRLEALLLPIQEAVFKDRPGRLEMSSGKRRLEFARLIDVAPTLREAGEGDYKVVGNEPMQPPSLSLFIDQWSVTIELEVWVEPGDHQLSLNQLTTMAVALNNACLKHGNIGPTFSLRWMEPDYPRPLPPRSHPAWPPGAVAYYLSAAYHASEGPDSQAMFALLKDAPLPQGILRQQQGDLLVIQAAEHIEPREEFESQLYKLEVWVGRLLDLKFDPAYQANGDKKVSVWSKENGKPFSFYDDSTRIGYKVVAEGRGDELDAETWAELEAMLPLRSLPDGRPVKATRVILVGRAAALRHLPRIRELGGSAALYLDEDGELWDPAPAGRWIRTDWNEV
jgi:hypothetical protein